MSLDKRLSAFVNLGQFLCQFSEKSTKKVENILHNDIFFDIFKTQIKRAKEYNGWFNDENVLFSLENWGKSLTKENLEKWISHYNITDGEPKTIAVIMAGNIPLVGFHDFLSVLITGNNIIAKLSSNDKHFLPLIAKYLEYVEPSFKGKITFTDKELSNFDAVIATGSNNTARYFEYYFGKYPSIIRKNRNSVAILTGSETHEELESLGEDIFRYFGLGCRNVSKLLVPREYDFDNLFKALYNFNEIINYKKYQNNYDYNKAVYLMSLFKLQENGFLMLKEDESYSSPIATVFYEYYDSEAQLLQLLKNDTDKIQCIVSNLDLPSKVNFGKTQTPNLWDYADDVDIIKFILELT
ncbi:acyl-CoA reductase [Urechidicola croceus]|uniref:Acyl-CoA reductase n=1 Tax=Urechidicola croceus TaxID=1850246 RepID=A0A1D8P534_9FLAO|nr:acyl-CoA reductase [Urechidicola croceus]AOW19675.1 acyl-CoA reductase [Urechidicola croceus]